MPVSGACAPSDVPASTALSTNDSAFTRAEWGVEPLPIDSCEPLADQKPALPEICRLAVAEPASSELEGKQVVALD